MSFFSWLKNLFKKKEVLKPVETPPAPKPKEPVFKSGLKRIGGTEFHPVFEVPEGFTHPHPLDILRFFAGQKEVPGSKDNPLIAHFHEHAENLGKHSETNDYHDEVPHCSSAWNWACDMAKCRKTGNALAASWKKYNNPREGDWVEEGDLVVLGTRHVTAANRRFNKRMVKTFEGFGSNQGNSIKTSLYDVAEISSVQIIEPLKGTILAPICSKPYPLSGKAGESVT